MPRRETDSADGRRRELPGPVRLRRRDRYGVRVEHTKVGDDFNPEVGFVRRDDFGRTFGLLRFSPRPESIESVRKFTWEASLEYLENGAGQLETRAQAGRFNTEFETSDQFTLDASNNYELLVAPFRDRSGRHHPAGRIRLRRRDRSATCSASSAGSPAPSRCSAAASTTATSRP